MVLWAFNIVGFLFSVLVQKHKSKENTWTEKDLTEALQVTYSRVLNIKEIKMIINLDLGFRWLVGGSKIKYKTILFNFGSIAF